MFVYIGGCVFVLNAVQFNCKRCLFTTVVYKGLPRLRRINLFLHENHYDVIKSMKGFYGSDYYCVDCDKPYYHTDHHRCQFWCPICLTTECTPGTPRRCNTCDRLCPSEECFQRHKSTTGKQQLSVCDKIYQCRECTRVIRRQDCPKGKHRCGYSKCPLCQEFVIASEHRCFLGQNKAKTPSENLIFFDFETDQSTGEHLVNYAVAQYADGRESVFSGYDACEKFCAFLFASKHQGYTAIAHNMRGFDGQFVLGWMIRQGLEPEIIPNGSKIMSIELNELNIRVIDSFNFLPMALSKLPKTYGIEELQKGFFPHLFNTPENQNYVGKLPGIHFYSPDSMSKAGREAFLQWHEEHQEQEFNFKKEMYLYCKSDVDILRKCCLEFRSQFLAVTGVDPFQYVTIASACMATFRSQHIMDNTIAMVPVHGYVNNTNYSRDNIRWLDFVASSHGITIQHALSGGGEKKIGGNSVDGFCEANKTVFQYHGCFFHGCPSCYDPDTVHPLSGLPMGTLYKNTCEITEKLRRNHTVEEMWEHEFKAMQRTDPALKAFLANHDVVDRLNPRDAFFGGRTNAVQLYFKGEAKYYDFTSLYPWTNKYCIYPVGHPQVITEGFGKVEDYFGFIKCKVLPPRGLYHPVLPHRCNDKLMFPLCRACAESCQKTPCDHDDSERAITGTWVTEEVKKALEKGYKILKIYEVYHFTSKSTNLFRSYIDLFLKIKQEASGWPEHCTTDEAKAEYIRNYLDKEGVQLNADSISKNPGRRQVAKLALNSFWGRWGMNLDKTRLSFVGDTTEFNKTLSDPTKNIREVYFPTSDVAAVQWRLEKEFISQDTSTNIFLAAFTTAHARLRLYDELEKLGLFVLYMDTDSIVFDAQCPYQPLLGDYLGELTSELSEGDVITTFVSGGPKNYAFETKGGETVCKVRGFTLNFRNAQKLNFQSVLNLVLSLDPAQTIPIHNPAKITREPKQRKVVNHPETKLYRVVYNKRILREDYSTVPYGF